MMPRQENASIQLNLADNLSSIIGDSAGLLIVLGELIDNAIKFAYFHNREAAKVIITSQARAGSIVIKVEDNGCGFPNHINELIFDLFYQYDREYYEQQGAGIGLSIARGIIDLHGGHFEVFAQTNEGATFQVVLPTKQAGSFPPRARVSDENGRTPATVLIVEDDYHLLLGLQDLLEIIDSKYAFNILTAYDGNAALEIMRSVTPNLILSDILMPEMDGYTFLQRVRSKPEWLEIPFLFLSAKDRIQDQHKGWRSGISEYITKPYQADELTSLIEKQLDRYFKVRSLLAQDFEDLKRSILNMLPAGFNSPLTTVNQYSNELTSLVEAAQTEQALKATLHEIQANNAGLTRLIENFIALVELKTNESILSYQLQAMPIADVDSLVSQIFKLTQPLAKHGFQIKTSQDNDLAPIFGVYNKIVDSVQRILNTFVQTYPAGSDKKLHVHIGQTEQYVEIVMRGEVQFPTQTADDIQQILLQEDAATVQRTPYAPDLRIAVGNIGLHNGNIRFDNQQAGQFTIMLPVYGPSG